MTADRWGVAFPLVCPALAVSPTAIERSVAEVETEVNSRSRFGADPGCSRRYCREHKG